MVIPATEPIASTQLYPLSRRAGSIDRTVGTRSPTTIRYRLDPTGKKQWRLTLETVRVVHLQQADDGSLLITEEEELAEDVSVTYTPPIVMLPVHLSMNQPINQETHMTVRKRKGGAIQDQGRCRYHTELLGSKAVVTPTGTFNAWIVRTRRNIELQMAQVAVTSDTAYVPGRGWVLERITRVTRPMNLFEVTQTEALQLAR